MPLIKCSIRKKLTKRQLTSKQNLAICIFLSCLYQYDVDKDLLFKVICLKLKKVITYQKIKVENSKIKVGNPKIKSWNLK